jgi:hypothetical protein
MLVVPAVHAHLTSGRVDFVGRWGFIQGYGDMEFHSLCVKYPLMPKAELERIECDMKNNGFDKRFPIILFQNKILDGRNRFVASSNANVEPVYVEFEGDESEAERLVVRANEERRHLNQEWMIANRKERIERVANARANGQSIRTIAENEGVSPATVKKDVDSISGVHPRTPDEEPKVNGKDGKKYSPKKKEKKSGVHPRTPEKEVAVDNYRNPLPKHCLSTFQDPWIQAAIDSITEMERNFREERIADGMAKRAKHYPFFNQKDFIDGVGFVQNYLEQLSNHLNQYRPVAVCPSCGGDKCADCRMSGLVYQELYEKLKGVSK